MASLIVNQLARPRVCGLVGTEQNYCVAPNLALAVSSFPFSDPEGPISGHEDTLGHRFTLLNGW